MQNIVLTIHLLLAMVLIATVLMQRSEGGGLGIGGGGDKLSSGRASTTPLQKFTWILAVGFLVTSVSLTWLASHNTAGSSVIERLGAGDVSAPVLPGLDGDLTPPVSTDTPIAPPPGG